MKISFYMGMALGTVSAAMLLRNEKVSKMVSKIAKK